MDESLSKPQSSGKRRRNLARDERGQSTVELAFVLPVVLMLLTASVGFAVVFNQQLELTYATGVGGQLLSISRGQTTDPCNTTAQAVYGAAPYLTAANLKFTIVLGSTTVANNAASPSCSGSQQYLVQSNNAQVKVTYPCTVQIFGISAPSCTLSAQVTNVIQ